MVNIFLLKHTFDSTVFSGQSGITNTASKTKVKKSKEGSSRRLVQPIPLDNTGRPVFPITLGSLTVHSLGEVRFISQIKSFLLINVL